MKTKIVKKSINIQNDIQLRVKMKLNFKLSIL